MKSIRRLYQDITKRCMANCIAYASRSKEGGTDREVAKQDAQN